MFVLLCSFFFLLFFALLSGFPSPLALLLSLSLSLSVCTREFHSWRRRRRRNDVAAYRYINKWYTHIQPRTHAHHFTLFTCHLSSSCSTLLVSFCCCCCLFLCACVCEVKFLFSFVYFVFVFRHSLWCCCCCLLCFLSSDGSVLTYIHIYIYIYIICSNKQLGLRFVRSFALSLSFVYLLCAVCLGGLSKKDETSRVKRKKMLRQEQIYKLNVEEKEQQQQQQQQYVTTDASASAGKTTGWWE